MRTVLAAGIVGLGLLAGCGSSELSSYLYKEMPVTLAEKEDDMFACRLEAAQAVPANNVTTSTPVWTTPVSCVGTRCYGGTTGGGKLKTTDTNRFLRNEYTERCYAKKGYVRTSSPIPICDPKKVDISNITMTSLIHQPVEGACWAKVTEHAFIIILPEDQKSPEDQ